MKAGMYSAKRPQELSLTESKMFKRQEQINKEPFDKIVGRIFSHILALEVLSHLNIRSASDYVTSILRLQAWKGFKPQASDLYNFLTVVFDQAEYADKIPGYKKITIPELRIKRYLRALNSGRADHADFNNLIVLLQQSLGISSNSKSSELLYVKKMVMDWDKLNHADRKKTVDRLALVMREMGNPGSDLVVVLRGIVASKGANL